MRWRLRFASIEIRRYSLSKSWLWNAEGVCAKQISDCGTDLWPRLVTPWPYFSSLPSRQSPNRGSSRVIMYLILINMSMYCMCRGTARVLRSWFRELGWSLFVGLCFCEKKFVLFLVACEANHQSVDVSFQSVTHPSIHPSIDLSSYPFNYPSFYQITYPSIYSSFHLSICPFMHLFIHWSTCSSIY